MAHPKHRISKTRRDKRRSHHKLTPVQLTVCAATGEMHRRHHAYVVDGDLYKNGQVVIKDFAPSAA